MILALDGAAAVDDTLTPEANGIDVVDAVVDRIRSNCIFANDRLFLRRLAYVETSDGSDPKTYRPKYHGGIWQIDENNFGNISCNNPLISGTCDLIESTFNITWSQVIWTDLRTPLFSGLAAALYIQGNTPSPPINITTQAQFWVKNMRTGGNASYFEEKAQKLIGSACKMDIAFLLDGSGSVSLNDFDHMISFIQKMVNKLDVTDDDVHVSVLEYAGFVGDTITFNNFTSKADLIASIDNIRKSGGGTSTHLAIQYTTSVLFSNTTGARRDVKRVAILFTDGASNSFNSTVNAAAEAKEKGITMVAVGVGSVNLIEIESIATAPNCTHSYFLQNFSEVDSLLYQLEEKSCSAVIDVKENQTIAHKIPHNKTDSETYKLQPKEHVNGSSEDSQDSSDLQHVVKTEVQCGSLEIFASFKTPHPGPAFYDIYDSASDNRPSIIYLNTTQRGRSLYFTVVATSEPVTSCIYASYKIVTLTIKTSNLCVAGKISLHEHPTDMTKFIICDAEGKMYITQCPDYETFNIKIQSCGNNAVGGSNWTSLPAALIQRGECLVEKSKPCPPGLYWSENDNTCSQPRLSNPCNGTEDGTLFAHEQANKYILCSFGKEQTMPCPEGLVFDSAIKQCNYP